MALVVSTSVACAQAAAPQSETAGMPAVEMPAAELPANVSPSMEQSIARDQLSPVVAAIFAALDAERARIQLLNHAVRGSGGVGRSGSRGATHLGAGAAKAAPFSGSTRLAFDLAVSGEARLEVFDVRGARLRTLVSGSLAAGRHEVVWHGEDNGGRRLPHGVYFVRLKAGGQSWQRKVVKIE